MRGYAPSCFGFCGKSMVGFGEDSIIKPIFFVRSLLIIPTKSTGISPAYPIGWYNVIDNWV
jgi:hypothetical protein